MRLEYGLEAQRLLHLLLLRMVGSLSSQLETVLVWRFVQSAYSLSLAMGHDHHFDHHWPLSTEVRLSPESLSLRKIGRLGTFVVTLPMSGGQTP